MINITNEDNMILMAKYQDNHFDLAIVDPPYGIREDGHKENNRSVLAKSKKYHTALWDQSRPSSEYFIELRRISKNQIIWGANHLCDLTNMKSSCWIVWDKVNGSNDFSDCELAYTSFDKGLRMLRYMWSGMMQGKSISEGHTMQGNKKMNEKRIHPTQKPVKLYEWLLINYAKKGDKIFDTHLGSGSIAIACHNLGYDLTACELDQEYYEGAMKRLKMHMSQIRMFN